ncbi:hypothetical protein Tco_1048662, partial [Tanacetum coccineum]
MWHGHILQGLGKRNRIEAPNLCALNATTIMIDSVLQSVPTARGLAMSPGTIEPSLLLPTTRDPKGKIREFSLALNVELRVISRIMPEIKEQESGKSSWECSLIDIIPTILDHGYDVELAD